MTNEIVKNLDFGVNYKQSEITINNKEQLIETVQQYANKYQGFIFTEEDIQQGKSVRAELKKVATAIDDKRKEVKKQFNQPYVAFESEVKGIISLIEDVSDPIDSGIKELEEKQRKEKIKTITELVSKMALENEVDPSMIVTSQSWTNKTASMKQIEESIQFQINNIKIEEERKQGEIAIVKSVCEAYKIDSTGWLSHLDRGDSAAAIVQKIEASEKRKREEEERKKAEEARLAELEKQRLAAQEQAEKERMEQEAIKEVYLEDDVLTEENYVEDPFVEVPTEVVNEPVFEQPRTSIIEITGTETQFKQLNQYMKTLGIKVKAYNPEA